jgi:hypothetical protein
MPVLLDEQQILIAHRATTRRRRPPRRGRSASCSERAIAPSFYRKLNYEAVQVPSAQQSHGYAFREFARRHGDFAIVACAAVAGAHSLRLTIGGVGGRTRLGYVLRGCSERFLSVFLHDCIRHEGRRLILRASPTAIFNRDSTPLDRTADPSCSREVMTECHHVLPVNRRMARMTESVELESTCERVLSSAPNCALNIGRTKRRPIRISSRKL